MKKLENYTKDQLIELIKEINESNKKIKYGLIWENEIEKEDCVELVKNQIPVLKKELSIKNTQDDQENIIIKGENYHSLVILNQLMGDGYIDIIYIDPPYFTGNEDFAYNDNFVNKDDAYKHSKWLNFMEKRIVLSKNLLKNDGLFFVSIDDNEQANLKLLCDKIFGEANFVSQFIIDKTAQGANQSKTFKTQHEYCLLYKKELDTKVNSDLEQESDPKKYKYKDKKGIYAITNSFDSINSPLSSNKNRGYTIYYNPETHIATIKDEYNRSNGTFNDYDAKLLSNGFLAIRPGIRKGVQYPWNWIAERFLNEYKEELVFRKNKQGSYQVLHKNRATGKVKDTTIKKFDTRLYGNQLLVDIIGDKKFTFPKSVDMMKWLISKHVNKDAKVLDYFAGSGTTGQAVIELNQEDGGNRSFILCTNDENNICTDVTYPRLKTVITGIRPDGSKYSDGIKANLHYYKTDLIPNSGNSDQSKYDLLENVNHLLCIRENVYDLIDKSDKHYIYSSSSGKKEVFMFIDYYEKISFNKFFNSIRSSRASEKIVYVFSTDNIVDERLFDGIKGIELKPIPSKIYEIYKEIVEDIKRG